MSSLLRFAFLLLAASVGLTGCDPASVDACAEAGALPGVLEIGTGWDSFDPIEDGDIVAVSWGMQGGLHVYGSLQVGGVVQGLLGDSQANDPIVAFYILLDGELFGGYGAYQRHLTEDEDGVLSIIGDELVLNNWDPAVVNGLEVILTATIIDGCGRTLTAERTVTLSAE